MLRALSPTPDDISAAFSFLVIMAGALWLWRHPETPPGPPRIHELDAVGSRLVIFGEGVRIIDDHDGYVLEGPYDWRLEQA